MNRVAGSFCRGTHRSPLKFVPWITSGFKVGVGHRGHKGATKNRRKFVGGLKHLQFYDGLWMFMDVSSHDFPIISYLALGEHYSKNILEPIVFMEFVNQQRQRKRGPRILQGFRGSFSRISKVPNTPNTSGANRHRNRAELEY